MHGPFSFYAVLKLLPDNHLPATTEPAAHALELLPHHLAVFFAGCLVTLGKRFYGNILAYRPRFPLSAEALR